MGQSSISPLQRNRSFEQFSQSHNWDKPEPHLPPTQQRRVKLAKNSGIKDIFDLISNNSGTSQVKSMRQTKNHFSNQTKQMQLKTSYGAIINQDKQSLVSCKSGTKLNQTKIDDTQSVISQAKKMLQDPKTKLTQEMLVEDGLEQKPTVLFKCQNC